MSIVIIGGIIGLVLLGVTACWIEERLRRFRRNRERPELGPVQPSSSMTHSKSPLWHRYDWSPNTPTIEHHELLQYPEEDVPPPEFTSLRRPESVYLQKTTHVGDDLDIYVDRFGQDAVPLDFVTV
ncbi:hypothetical protein NMY22_g18418 [Coprinellus aureogranulatus]|nr:hypothetical protein NMY22_g18418 [Coprinellus aureogranulatus]